MVERIGGPDASDQNTVFKFLKSSEKGDKEAASISKKELALFSLQQNISRIEAKLEFLMSKTGE